MSFRVRYPRDNATDPMKASSRLGAVTDCFEVCGATTGCGRELRFVSLDSGHRALWSFALAEAISRSAPLRYTDDIHLRPT
jgi:hypothetical protein